MPDIKVKQIEPMDEEILELWVHDTEEEEILGVEAQRLDNDEWPWQVGIYVAEFIREEPLESRFRSAIMNALKQTPGVTDAVEEDREVWIVQGNVTGDALVRGCVVALNSLADDLRKAVEAL